MKSKIRYILEESYALLRQKLKIINSNKRKPLLFKHEGIPYYSQWESKNLVGKIIRKEQSAKDDPNWANSGAQTPEEYVLWSWNACGMACLKMILSHQFKNEIPIVTLGKKCMEYGGYVQKGEKLDGLYYRTFLDFIRTEYGLLGKVVFPLSQEDIIKELLNSNYVIASVHHQIRRPDDEFTGKKGGHLVLISGCNIEIEIFYIHNPSGDTQESQEYAPISFTNFEKFFAHRGIVIFNQKTKEDNQVL